MDISLPNAQTEWWGIEKARGWVILNRDWRANSAHLRGPLIFPSHTGMARDITNRRERVWKPALRRAQLRYRTMYQTRHTIASLALQSGEQLGWISKQLGQTHDEMVIRHYAKFIPNLTRQDGSALARVMGSRESSGGGRAPIRARNVRKMSGNRKGLRARDP